MCKQIFKRFFPHGYKDEFIIVIKNAIPILIGSISQLLLGVISALFCGHLGQDEFAAVTLSVSIINMVGLAVLNGITSGCDTYFPQFFGANAKQKVGIILQRAIVIGIFSSLISTILIANARNLLYIIAESENVAILTDEYIIVYIPSIFFFTLSTILSKFLQAQNIVKPITVINFIAVGINCAFHAIFIYLLNWGLRGAAFAVDIASFSILVMCLSYIYLKKNYVGIWNGWSSQCLYGWRTYLKLSIPAILALLIEYSNWEIGTLCAATFDKVQVAALGVIQNVCWFAFNFSFSIGIAANIRIGQLLGANKPDEAKNAFRVCFTINLMSIFTIGSLFVALHPVIPYIFTTDEETLKLGKMVVLIGGVLHLLDGTSSFNNGILRTIGAQAQASFAVFIGFYLVGSPIGLPLMFKTSLRIYGFLIGGFVGLVVVIMIQFFYILRIDWEKKAQESYDFANSSSENVSENNNSKTGISNVVYDYEQPKLEENNKNGNSSNSDEEHNAEASGLARAQENQEMTNREKSIKIIIKLLVFLILLLFLSASVYLHIIDIGKPDHHNCTNSTNSTFTRK